MKDGDYIEHLFVCSSHDFLLFFSNRGKVYRSKVYELPEAQRTAKGRALVNVLPLREGERIQSVLSTRDFAESKYLVFATKKGTVKKTEFGAYNTPIKADGIIAIKIRDDDELVAVRRVDPGEEILMISKEGLAVRFAEEDARAMGRDTGGVRGMNITGEGNEVLTMDVARDDQEVLVVTENGFGKRTPVERVPQDLARRQGRADDQVLREARRPGRGARRAPAPGAALHLPGGDGPAHRRARDPPDRPLGAGRDAHERARRRPRVGRRAGRRVRRADRGGGGRTTRSPTSTPATTAARWRSSTARSRPTTRRAKARRSGRRGRRRRRRRTGTPQTGIESSPQNGNLGSPEKGGGPYR